MNNPKISLIAAIASKNRAIGKDNKLIYKIPEDMKRFKELTTGHVVIMGRKTFESIGKALPNRMNIVVTSEPSKLAGKGVFAVNSLRDAFYLADEKEKREVFVIGGAQIYKQAMWRVNKLYLTIVDDNPKGADTFFPDYSEFKHVVFEKEDKYGNLN